MAFSQNDLVTVSREVETVPGTVDGGARDRVYGTAPTWTPGSNELTSALNTGDGGIKSVRAGLRYGDVEIPSELVYGLNDSEFEDVMRDTFAGSEATVTGVSVTFDNAGTHVNGTTGPVITGAANAFDNLLGLHGFMLETTGASNADNNLPRAIKHVKADGSQIDIEPQYVAGTTGNPGAPLTAEGPVSVTLRCGDGIRNQGIENIRSVNFEFEYTDQSGGSFLMAKGQHGSGLKIAFDGKGIVKVTFMYMGMDFDIPTTTTQGNGTVNPNTAIYNPSMTSAEDLSYFLVNAVTQLAGDSLTNFNLDATGSASGIDETCGSRSRVGVTVGDYDVTGGFKVLHEQTKMALLSTLGFNGTICPLDMKFADPDGNWYWIRLPETLLAPSGPKPAGKGSRTDGTFSIKTQLGSSAGASGAVNALRTMIVQKFAAA